MPTVTIPTKHNINRNSGTILLRVSKPTDSTDKEVLMSTGDFSLFYGEGFLVLNNREAELKTPVALFPDTIDCIWTWVGDTHRLFVTSETEGVLVDTTSQDNALPGIFGSTLVLSNTPAFTGNYHSVSTYAKDFLFQPGTLYEKRDFLNSADLLFRAAFNEAKRYSTAPIIETTYAPRDGSPVLVSDQEGPLRRQYFFDSHTGEYTDINTERFLYRGDETIVLSYDGLSPSFKTILKFAGGDTFLAIHRDSTHLRDRQNLTRKDIEEYLAFEKDYGETDPEGSRGYAFIDGDTVHLTFEENEQSMYYGQELFVTYQLSRSYNVEYNTDTAHDSLRIQLADHQSRPIEVIQEGNRFSNTRLGREIELNPLVNPQHTGFLYIDKEAQETQSFRLNVSNDYVLADGLDTADFIIEAIDAEGNEVLSPYLDVFIMDSKGQRTTSLGRLEPVIHFDTLKARNMAGRCYYRYQAPQIKTEDYPQTQRVFLVALDRDTRRGMQIPIYIRPVNILPENVGVSTPLPQGVSRVFESIARWYERELPEDHPLHHVDQGNDGMIDREDFEFFKTRLYEDAWINELHTALTEREGS